MLQAPHAAATARATGAAAVVLQQEGYAEPLLSVSSCVLNKDLERATGAVQVLSTFIQNRCVSCSSYCQRL